MRRSLCCKFHFPKYTSSSSACENPVCVTQFWMRKMEWKCKTWFCVTITTILAFFQVYFLLLRPLHLQERNDQLVFFRGYRGDCSSITCRLQQSEKTRLFFHSRDISRNEVKKSKDQNSEKNIPHLKCSKIHLIFREKTMYYNSVAITYR